MFLLHIPWTREYEILNRLNGECAFDQLKNLFPVTGTNIYKSLTYIFKLPTVVESVAFSFNFKRFVFELLEAS